MNTHDSYSHEPEDIVNEGFLYIDNTSHDCYDDITLTFKKGKIIDMNGKNVCCGEILPIMDYDEFELNKNKINYYSLKLKGTQVRVYKYSLSLDTETDTETSCKINNHNNVIISLESVIYPHDLIMSETELKDQINYELLEEGKCYYAVITTDRQIILTYITDINNPKLEVPNLIEDKVFKYHVEVKKCVDETAMETFKNNLNKKKEENGIVFYRDDGQPFEFWSITYHQFKNYKRPYNMPYPNYYVLLLNKYPLDSNNYIDFFKDLHYDIEFYLKYYPEDIEIFNLMKKKLDVYVTKTQEEYYENHEMNHEHQIKNKSFHTINVFNQLKISILKELLCLDKEYDCVIERVVKEINKKNENNS